MTAIRKPGRFTTAVALAGVLAAGTSACSSTKGASSGRAPVDPYAEFVFPAPPDEARIRLSTILTGRADVETTSGLGRALLGASPEAVYDNLTKPHGVAYDPQGRILVTDSQMGSILRFDRAGRRLDVFGTKGALPLRTPLGIHVSGDGTIFVADGGLKKVLAFDPEGRISKAYGRTGELLNPTDALPSPDGKSLFIVDAAAHKVWVFDRQTGAALRSFGTRGEAPGQFNFPTALAIDRDGNLFVVDQGGARVEIFAPDGEILDTLGGRGLSAGQLVRPKAVAIDGEGIIYVTDAVFCNVQLFDSAFNPLTAIGRSGGEPGQFRQASGVAAFADEFAVVDQTNGRVQVFRYLSARTGAPPVVAPAGSPRAGTPAPPPRDTNGATLPPPPPPSTSAPPPLAGSASAAVPAGVAPARTASSPAPAGPSRASTLTTPDWTGREPVFAVHFSSFRDRARADKDAARLGRSLERPAHALSADLGEKGVWYRVMIGEFATIEAALAFRAELERKGTPDLGSVYRIVGKTP